MIHVVIMSGQSNMRGYGDRSQLKSSEFPDTVSLFDLNYHPECFGPEYGFAQSLSVPIGDQVWLVKYARNGTSLLAWSPQWTKEKAELTGNGEAGPLYSHLMDHFQKTIAGHSIHLGAMLWMQGETDAKYQHSANDYQTNLTHFIHQVRQDLNAPNLPFIMGRVNPPECRFPFGAIVRDAQEQVTEAVDGVQLIETDDLPKLEDQLHYDTQGQLELGRRFAGAVSGKLF